MRIVIAISCQKYIPATGKCQQIEAISLGYMMMIRDETLIQTHHDKMQVTGRNAA